MSWWTRSEGPWQWSLGLHAAQLCGVDRCDVAALDRFEWSAPGFRAGVASYAAALLAGGLLLATALSMAAGRARSLLTSTTLVAVVSAGVAGILFVWMVPDYPDMSTGYSMYSYFAGAITGAIACLTALRAAPT